MSELHMSNPCAAQPALVKEIPATMDSIQSACDMLANMLDDLQARLSPITTQAQLEKSTECAVDSPPAVTALGSDLAAVDNRIRGSVGRLATIIGTVEL